MRGRTRTPIPSTPGRSARVVAPTPPPAVAVLCAPVVFQLQAGPYQNNGASQWFAKIPIGTPGQTLKIALDTGSNFIWTTSTLCSPTGCIHYGGGRFDYSASRTFAWVDQTPQDESFGPWGTMVVETGSDVVGLPGGASLPTTFFLAQSYSGEQFAQLDWDGGIGIPSGSAYVDPSVSFVVAEMMNRGLIDPELPYVAFGTDPAAGSGTAILGGFDPAAFDPFSGVFMRWSPYTAFAGVEYIWSTALDSYAVGDEVLATNVMFCLDSGSSQFKGDDDIMNQTLALVSGDAKPDVRLTLGTTFDGGPAEIVVPPSVYMVKIQAGPDKDKVLPQFNPLGLTDLVLVGSVLMDHCYTIYEYDVTQVDGGYVLAPVGMWLFNKAEGEGLVRSRSARPAELKRKPVRRA